MRFKYLFVNSVISLMLLSSCENFLDKDPLDRFSENAVWSNKDLVEANLADLYAMTPFFDGEDGNNAHAVTFMGGEALKINASGTWISGTLNEKGGVAEHWAYSAIYLINTFIERVGESPLEPKMIEIRKAEARFLRAYRYFEMVKRYGGIPLILKTQSIDDDYDELYVKRNSEKEVYDFIDSECEEIAKILPDVSDEYGRVTKYTALALKSRAMLYAASVAQFGTLQLDGLLGFSKDEAAKYWQKSYDASKQIIDSGLFSLFNKYEDKAQNFQYIFLEERNSETIFSKVYNGKSKVGHSYDHRFYPEFLAKEWGGECCPYWETIEDFGYVDGRDGKIDKDYLLNNLIDFDELFSGKDPRFYASIIYPGAKFKEKTFYSHKGTIVDGETILTNKEIGYYNGEMWYAVTPSLKSMYTGFTIRKYVDELADSQYLPGESDTDFIIYRYGEIILNMAEAAFELGKEDEALNYINMIRDRAGVKMRDKITREMIHNERNVELAFEGHRYWDVRRWRVAVDELSTQRNGVELFFDWDSKKYKVSLKKADPVDRGFTEKMYYLPITVTRISNNPNLAPENPGY